MFRKSKHHSFIGGTGYYIPLKRLYRLKDDMGVLAQIRKLHAPKGACVLRNSKEFRTFVRNSQANCVDSEFGQSIHPALERAGVLWNSRNSIRS